MEENNKCSYENRKQKDALQNERKYVHCSF